MRSLVLFILKYQNFMLFLLLELASFSLLVNRNSYHNSKFYHCSLTVMGGVYEKQRQVSDYFSLRSVNEDLANENAILQELIIQGTSSRKSAMVSIQDPLADKDIDVIAAKVVKTTVNQQRNHITINVGAQDGIEPDMAVVSSLGVVGVIKTVAEHYSIVLPLINIEYRVSSKLSSNDYFGTMHWDTNNYKYASLQGIEQHVDVAIGDTIVTSGYGAVFPEGIVVGYVSDVEPGKEGVFHTIQVKLATDYKRLTYVYVMYNNTMSERRALEQNIDAK